MKSPIKWIGGKSKSLKYLLPLIPVHEGYVEVFGGAGWLIFGKEPSKWEVLNDLDDNLSNFWNVLKNHEIEFIKSFDFEVISRTIFNEYKKIYITKKYNDNIQQAHILYYLLKAGTSGRLPDGGGCGFGRCKGKSRLRLDKTPKDIIMSHQRLINVSIECRDFKDIIKFYDTNKTFFYLDPPYRSNSCAPYPVGKFTDDDYTDLYNLCSNMKGNFLLSINNDNFINSLFSKFNITKINVPYCGSIKQKGREKYAELIITNYKLIN
ncbi:DNA adenine methylase [Clostridium estertheticum]|uniref:DNA adenine methylase n=1 Tax=Clostridium estertheticum TaxID=238834 RepID=UPI001C7DC087|nr:DNA adenine methylase [Clostridium estertheticum]MBX4261310.1 DNA adenine methylase [Clostridium estertheticum]WLC71653.1 DNA adenine methylase [Clostridium estertheticum]